MVEQDDYRGPMTRLLSNDEIASLVSISDCLEILERSYLELDAGDAITIDLNPAATVAEPDSLALVGLALVAFAVVQRKRR